MLYNRTFETGCVEHDSRVATTHRLFPSSDVYEILLVLLSPQPQRVFMKLSQLDHR